MERNEIMIINVAVVEDDDLEFKAIFEQIKKFVSEENDVIDINITRFTSASLLLVGYKPVYDIIFMDIGLPGLNGFEASKQLREFDNEVILIFVTSMARFAVSGYEVGAFDFIVKPVQYANIRLKLIRALNRLKTKKDYAVIKIKTKGGVYSVNVNSIKYVEVMNRNLVYHTQEGDIETIGVLKNAEGELPCDMFARCNNCYLVNLKYVKSVKDFTVIVDDKELSVSRSRKKEFLQMLGSYIGKGGN